MHMHVSVIGSVDIADYGCKFDEIRDILSYSHFLIADLVLNVFFQSK